MTPAEKRFWNHVRGRMYPGLRFRRQQPIAGFIADFYCDALRLVVEIDGEVHDEQVQYDAERTAELAKRGVRVLRFTNDAVLNDLPLVMNHILALRPAHRSPPPLGEGQGGGVVPAHRPPPPLGEGQGGGV